MRDEDNGIMLVWGSDLMGGFKGCSGSIAVMYVVVWGMLAIRGYCRHELSRCQMKR